MQLKGEKSRVIASPLERLSGVVLLLGLSTAVLGPAALVQAQSAAPAGAPAAVPASTPDARTLAKAEALRLWELRADVKQLPAILKALEQWAALDPTNAEPLVLLSRGTYVWTYLHESGSEAQRMEISRRGYEAGKKATRLKPSDPAGDFWAATNLAVYGKLKGPIESASSYGELRERVDRALARQPDYFYGGIYRFYGRLIDQVPGMLRSMYGYSLQDAVDYHQKAVKTEPRYIQSYLFLAEALLQQDKRQEAKQLLEAALKRDPSALPEVLPENKLVLQQIRKVLQKEFSKG